MSPPKEQRYGIAQLSPAGLTMVKSLSTSEKDKPLRQRIGNSDLPPTLEEEIVTMEVR